MIKENNTVVAIESDKQDVLIIREFDGPRELVFQAWTDPVLYEQWLGPRGYTMKIELFEPRNGGSWRYIHSDKKENDFVFHGVFHEVVFPLRIVQTFEYEGEKGHVSLETAVFEDLADDKTRVTMRSVFQTIEDRDRRLESGMEKGIYESFERLDELLARELSKG